MRQAKVRQPRELYIGGKWLRPASGMTQDVFNAGDETVYGRFAQAGEGEVSLAVDAARSAFEDGPWPHMSLSERAALVRALGEEITSRAADLAEALSCEAGMVAGWANMISGWVGGIYAQFADLAGSVPFEEKRLTERGGAGVLARQPIGVVAAIVPWNGPAMGIAHKVAPALVAGCTVILKVSPEAPAAGWILAEACDKVGLPAGVLNLINADRSVSEALVRNPHVDLVDFTGSTAAGRRIGSICADRIGRVRLELGGKSPALIMDDFDPGEAAQIIGVGSRMLSGQVCASLTRLIIRADRHDEFVEALRAVYGATVVGDPFEHGVEMGPLASAAQRDRVEGYIAKGKADGARLITGGKRPAHLDRGYFVEPTIFASCENSMSVAQEEIFGPVLCVIPAENETDAIRIANDTIYGLNATVFTNDVEKAYAAARKVRSGTVGHNSPTVDFSLGFGGLKQSGIGTKGGVASVLACTERKSILLREWPADFAADPVPALAT